MHRGPPDHHPLLPAAGPAPPRPEDRRQPLPLHRRARDDPRAGSRSSRAQGQSLAEIERRAAAPRSTRPTRPRWIWPPRSSGGCTTASSPSPPGSSSPSGYKNTHVTAIMRKLGITATLFYSHFPSKRRLLAECVTVLIEPEHRLRRRQGGGDRQPGGAAAVGRLRALAGVRAGLCGARGDARGGRRGRRGPGAASCRRRWPRRSSGIRADPRTPSRASTRRPPGSPASSSRSASSGATNRWRSPPALRDAQPQGPARSAALAVPGGAGGPQRRDGHRLQTRRLHGPARQVGLGSAPAARPSRSSAAFELRGPR